jgi:hypothetical protein
MQKTNVNVDNKSKLEKNSAVKAGKNDREIENLVPSKDKNPDDMEIFD